MLDVSLTDRLGAFTLDVAFSSAAPVTALFGRSGAGKTSIVNALAGLRRPRAGRIVVDGQVLFDSEAGIDVPPERRRLGYVFQEGRLFPHLSVRANLLYGWRRVPEAERHIGIDEVVALLDLAALLDRRPHNLSGGEKQRVAIGRALLASPRLLLMDEPLASLDAGRKGEILSFIERLRDEVHIPIVYVSHAVAEIVRLADTAVIVSDGRVAASGPVEDVMNRLDLRPLTGRFEAGTVIATRVEATEAEFGITRLAFPGGAFQVTGVDFPPGTQVRLRVRARDVALATMRPDHVSVLNVFSGTVEEIGEGDGAQIDVRLDIGVPLWARITRKSLVELGLKTGTPAFAMVKSVAIGRGSFGARTMREAEAEDAD